MAVEVRPMRDDDREAAMPIFVEAFGQPPSMVEQAVALPVADRWVVTEDGEVRGLLRVLPIGQFFGGRSVPAAGIAAVAIATQARGRGLGRELMRGTLRELHADGVAISTLYPASMLPYRAVGYEVAGERLRWSAPLDSLPRRPAGHAQAEPLTDDDLPAMRECLGRFAAARPGLMDRPEFWWEPRVLAVDDDQALYRYGVRGDDGSLRGYVVFTHHAEPGHLPDQWVPGDESPLAIATRDLVWLDDGALTALLALAAAHASIGTNLYWTGPSADPLQTLFRDRQPVVSSSYRWMARLVDVAAALEARGWPPRLGATFELAVEDPGVDGNSGAFRVTLAGGAASVERIGNASASVDIGALSAIYTGWLAPRAAAALGRLRGASADDLGLFEAAFAGPTSWLIEFF